MGTFSLQMESGLCQPVHTLNGRHWSLPTEYFPRHHLGMVTHPKRKASLGPEQDEKQGDERKGWERSRIIRQGAFYMGAKERGRVPAFILLSPPVGFRLWLLPSYCIFGLKTGEVNCCFGLICGNEVSEQLHLTELLGHLCV